MTVEPESIITDEENNNHHRIITPEDIEFVINIMKIEASYDEIALRQIFYGCASAFTKLPIHHNVNSRKSGAGKSYILTLVTGYFPDRYVLSFIGMSDKALMHEQGVRVLIDEETGNTIPIDPILNDLRTQLEELENKKDDPKFKAQWKEIRKQIKDIDSEIIDLLRKSEKLIELNNRIILMLDTPQEGLYNTLMSLVSQDTTRDQLYQFAEKNNAGKMGSPRNRLRGTPAMFTTQVIDDTRQVRYQEKNRRFIHVTPDTSKEKIHCAKKLIGQRYGLLPEEYDDRVVDIDDKQRAQDIIGIVIEKLIDHSKLLKSKDTGIRIPFHESIVEGIGGDETEWSMTVMDRLVRYLSVVTKVNMDYRPRIIDTVTGKFYPISTFADLKETLKLMELAGSALRPYITNWYNNVFLPAFRDLREPNAMYDDFGKIIEKETYKGLTTEQLSYWTQKFLGISLGTDDIRKQFIYPLKNMGMINTVKSVINGNEIICFPVEEGNIFSIFHSDKDLRLKVPYEFYPCKNVIEEELRTFVNHDVKEGVQNNKKYRLVDHEGNDITVQELIVRYLFDPWTCFINKEIEAQEESKKLCILGCHPIRNFSYPGWRRDLTRIQNNVVEENTSSEYTMVVEEEDSDYQRLEAATNEFKMGLNETHGLRLNEDENNWHCMECPIYGEDRIAIAMHVKNVHVIPEIENKLEELDHIGWSQQLHKQYSLDQLRLLADYVREGSALQYQIQLAIDYFLDGGRT